MLFEDTSNLRMFQIRFGALSCIALFCACLSGCSDSRPERVKVSGQVLIDGKPLTHGTVQVYPQAGRPAYGRVDEQGRFTLGTFTKDDGCPVGTHQVAIVAKEMIAADKNRWHTPKKYARPETSGLKFTAAADTADYVINLQNDTPVAFVPFIETIAAE